MMEAYCLRISKNTAGKTFPFDRVYLIPDDQRNTIEMMFRYAIVLPVEGRLLAMLRDVHVDQYVNRTQDRDDDENAATKMSSRDWNALLKDRAWLMVVAILPKWVKQSMPRYLTAESWYAQHYKSRGKKGKEALPIRESPFTNRSYLQTPQKKIRPICVVCPRMILHQNGECQIGGEHCFDNLPLGMTDHFEEAASLPSAVPNVNEPEEYELLEGESLVVEQPPTPNSRTRDLLRVIHE